MNVNEKLSALRKLMKQKNIDAYIIPSSDPHISEYVADVWFSRAWISGFDGSAATVVVTADNAGLWTDSRYFLQAEQQLEGSGIDLFKLGEPGVQDFPDWINTYLEEGSTVGFDGKCMQLATYLNLKSLFFAKNIKIVSDYDFIDEIWSDRPPIPHNPIFEHKVIYSGMTRNEKISAIQSEMKKHGATCHLLCTLDDIAWTFNIRGNDVNFNPVAISYALITENSAELYIFEDKIPEDVMDSLTGDGIIIKDYHEIGYVLAHLGKGEKLIIDANRTNVWLWNLIPDGVETIFQQNISTGLKASKNSTELKGMHNAAKRDAVAFVQFMHWLDNIIENNTIEKEKITELDLANKLYELRSQQEHFVGESFNSIIGYAGHGAIVHYSATEESNIEIGSDTFLLTDSGGQYFDGTTDITRMFHYGNPTEEEKRDYTLVLKGMIQLSMAKFPYGTRGAQLDVLARKHQWDYNMTYGHGTGHGVGCFLNVHEGPQNIRKEENPAILQKGMILSNEPGCYKAGKYGIRIENLIAVKEGETTEFGTFYHFETLTYVPIETKPIEKKYLSADEIQWLNNFHQKIYDEISPLLNDEMKQYLKLKTKAI